MFVGEAISNIGSTTDEIELVVEEQNHKVKKRGFFSRFLKDNSSK